MHLNGFTIPPLIIAVVATVLYGFDAFNSFSNEPTPLLRSESVAARLTQDSSKRQNFPALAESKKSESIDSRAVQIPPTATAAISSPGATAATTQNTQSSTNELSPARHLPTAAAIPNDEADEELTQVAHETFDENGEPLIAVTPSMATQATPVEMSDDGQIEVDTTAQDG